MDLVPRLLATGFCGLMLVACPPALVEITRPPVPDANLAGDIPNPTDAGPAEQHLGERTPFDVPAEDRAEPGRDAAAVDVALAGDSSSRDRHQVDGSMEDGCHALPMVNQRFYHWLAESSMVNGADRPDWHFGEIYLDPAGASDTLYDWGASVMRDGATYKMWWVRMQPHEQHGHDTIRYATSWDTVNWYDWGGAGEVLRAANWHPGDGVSDSVPEIWHVGRPSVLKVDGTYYMFYESPMSFDTGEWDNQVFLATSSDGVQWNKKPTNSDPRPLIALAEVSVDDYGVGQPSVLYKDGLFWIYYVEATDLLGHPQENRIRLVRMSKNDVDSFQSITWSESHPVVAYGSAFDVKWNSALGQFVLVMGADNFQGDRNTMNIGVFTSANGLDWYPDNDNNPSTPVELYRLIGEYSPANLVTYDVESASDFPDRLRTFTSLVGDEHGQMASSTMQVYYTDGDKAPLELEWRSTMNTWNLYMVAFVLGDGLPLLPDGLNAKLVEDGSIYKIWNGQKHSYSSWECFVDKNMGVINYTEMPAQVAPWLTQMPAGPSWCP